jgi:hypothetical protein
LEASKDYANSAGNLVRAFTTNLGKDRSQWSKHPNFLNVKPHLRDWWIEFQWKGIQKRNALKVLKCSEDQLVDTMKGHMRIKCTKELEQSDPELYKLKLKTRRCINWFLDKVLIGQACSLHQVTNLISVRGMRSAQHRPFFVYSCRSQWTLVSYTWTLQRCIRCRQAWTAPTSTPQVGYACFPHQSYRPKLPSAKIRFGFLR